MRARFRALALALLLPALAAADEPVQVWIDSPPGSDFVFGETDFVAAVTTTGGEEVALVEFFLDGRSIGIDTKAPFRLQIDVGYDNVEHEFKVVARTTSGLQATRTIRTPALKIDEEVDVELQQLYVTVTTGGQRVLDLGRGDFQVLDDGERQEIVTFETGDVPLTAALLLDCSISMKGDRLAAALAGAGSFVEGMRELDEASVILFSDRLLRTTEFTADRTVLQGALTEVDSVGGTAINDHLFVALKHLDERQGRRVVVLFSDGSDVHSVLPMKQVLQKARRSQALIYWIHLLEPGQGEEVPAYTTSWRGVEENQIEFRHLRRAVEDSGGRIQVLSQLEELEAAFSGILAELREQYVLGYYPSSATGDGSWHQVKVRVRRAGLKVRTRGGYLDY